MLKILFHLHETKDEKVLLSKFWCHLCSVCSVVSKSVQRMYIKMFVFFLNMSRILMPYTSDQTPEESLSLII